MSFKDRIARDNLNVFMNHDHFAEMHTWNGRPFQCIPDDEVALKRKNNNVVDVSWDNNTVETVLYVRKEDWPAGHDPMPNEHGYLDNKQMKVLQVQEDIGMWTILLMAYSPKGNGGME